MNVKDKRIVKLWLKGLSVRQIARKIGMPENLRRVEEELIREGFIREGFKTK